MTETKFNISQAAIIVGKTRPTVSRHIKSKRISYEVNENGHKMIDRSELERVYGSQCNFLRLQQGKETNETQRSENQQEGRDAVSKVQERLLEKYEQDNTHLRELLEKALDNQAGFTKMIEDRSHDKDQWRQMLEETREKIANETSQEFQNLQQRHKAELLKVKRALHNERKKTWWDKLWGREPNESVGRVKGKQDGHPSRYRSPQT